MSQESHYLYYLECLIKKLEKSIIYEKLKENSNDNLIARNTKFCKSLSWALSRLDPKMRNDKRIPANNRHLHNTKTYSITMSPEDHDRLVQLGKELHINGGFSGVLTYIAQNCVLIHE